MYYKKICEKHGEEYNALGSYCNECLRDEKINKIRQEVKKINEELRNLGIKHRVNVI